MHRFILFIISTILVSTTFSYLPIPTSWATENKELIKKLEKKEPVLKNYLAFYQGQDKLDKGDKKEAASIFSKLLTQPDLSDYLKTKTARLLGQAYCQSGKEKEALHHYQQWIQKESQSSTGQARVPFWKLEQAQCLLHLKQKSQALSLLRNLYLQDEQGQISEQVLSILNANHAQQAISSSEHESKGRRLLNSRPQLASLSFAAAEKSYSGTPPLALQQNLAEAYFRSRQYPEASRAYEALRKHYPSSWDEDTQLLLAQAYSRSDQFDQAIKLYQSMYGNQNQSASTLDYKIAFLYMDKGDLKEANRRFEEILAQYPKHPQRAKIYWFLAWNHYQLKDYESASSYLNLLSFQAPRSAYAKRVPYWRARIAEKQGKQSLAQTRYREITASQAGSYYGLLSEWRLKGRLTDKAKTPLPSANSYSGDTLLATLSGSTNAKQVLAALYELGLWKDFLGELQNYLRSRSTAEFLSSAERQGYPQPYYHWVQFFGSRYQIPPALIYAIMREESRFNPTIVSAADAIGLMQIIPSTGLEIAQDLDRIGFSTEWLTEPLVNVEFGTYYLGKNAKRFDRGLTQTIASYNAGPDAVTRWMTARPNRPWDEFVEEIPYTETHNYVKKVLMSYQRYGGI